MGFFKTLFNGYGIMFKDFNRKYNDVIPKIFSGSGTGLMMIGSAVMAKTSLNEDVQQVIAEANAAVEESRKIREGEKKPERIKRIFKARATRGWKLVKAYHKGIIMEAVGAGLVGAGLGISENTKHKAIAATAAIGGAFAEYRAAVREDLGEEADIKYLTGRKVVKRTDKVDKRTGEITPQLEYYEDEDGITIKKDPNAFRLLYSEQTTPNVWSSNYDLRKSNLEHIENNLNHIYRMTWSYGGTLTLNDMRREFETVAPRKMDVAIGGIFGRAYDKNDPNSKRRIRLHYDDDVDFMEGRKDWCWIIFDCDPEPIIGKNMNKFTKVEQ